MDYYIDINIYDYKNSGKIIDIKLIQQAFPR